jgi:hypothetical protein
MPRTTPELVEGIIEIEVGADLTPFILFANELVTEFCEDVGYSEERKELIERWLSAHAYAIMDPRTSSENVGIGVNFQSKVDLGLDVTHYGQQAKRLDTAGGLARLDQEMKKPAGTAAGGGPIKVGIRHLNTNRN